MSDYPNWRQLHPERGSCQPDRAHVTDPGGTGSIAKHRYSRHPGAISLINSTHFPANPYSGLVKPVALPPGRARLSAKPAPTGPTIGKTIGTVRVACSNGPTVEAPKARMTPGASAANSAACLRMSATLIVA